MPAVSHLSGVRGGFLDGAGVGAGPVTAHDLGTGMVVKPSGQRLGSPVWQDVDELMGFDVDEDRSVATTAAEGELVHAEHAWGSVRHGRSLQMSEEPHPARWNREFPAQPCSRPSAQFGCHGTKHETQAGAGPLVGLTHTVDLLNECPSLAGWGIAEEPANGQPNQHRPTGDGTVVQLPTITTVDPAGCDTALRTRSRRACTGQLDQCPVHERLHRLHPYTSSPRKEHALGR